MTQEIFNSNILQKRISFNSDQKDFQEINKHLNDGWFLINIEKNKSTHLCKKYTCILEKITNREILLRYQKEARVFIPARMSLFSYV